MSSEINLANWVLEINEELSKMKSPSKKEAEDIPPKKEAKYNPFSTIYRVDDSIRENFSESDYTPLIVSFGPYYHGHPSCESTQRVKKDVLLHFLKKSNKRLDECTEYFLKQRFLGLKYLKRKYSELDPKWQEDDDAFLRLMILDGCFLLEVAREACQSLEVERWGGNYESDSAVWRIDGRSITKLREDYIHDMLLLENQIPMRVLHYLLRSVDINTLFGATKQVNSYMLRLLSPFPWATEALKLEEYEHVLDLYRASLLFQGRMQWVRLKSNLLFQGRMQWVRLKSKISCFSSNHFKVALATKFQFNIPSVLKSKISCFSSNYFKVASATKFQFNIPSATELEKAGIGFTTNENMTLVNVSFNGITLRLPQIYMDGTTQLVFFNIIAFERLDSYAEKEVTSYVYFMSRLLRDVGDVKLLKLRGIINSALGSEEIIGVFDNLTIEHIMHDPDIFLVPHYKSMGRNMRKRYLSEWRKDLWQNYLRSPFGVVSVVAAFLLFALTATQTVYTILGYYNRK